MTIHDIFVSLTRNAFDFLEHSIAEFGKFPKYSAIHFYMAIEMLLKARLMKEHWTLIVSKPEQACFNKFINGEFLSVTLKDAKERLRNIANEDIGGDAYNSFCMLANHRNKMVHFFHSGLDSDEKVKEQIVAEHCRSWFYLHRLLIRWNDHFSDFSSEIDRANHAMKKHRKYLAAKFTALKAELGAARKAGNAPRLCSACDFKAAVPNCLDNQIALLHCLVCDHTETQVKIECPHCGKSIVIKNEGYAECGYCKGSIEPNHLEDALTDHDVAHIAIKDGDDTCNPVNCGTCGGYQTVILRGNHYFCTECFDISNGIEQCKWCTEYSTSDMEDSYLVGCNHCDGKWLGEG